MALISPSILAADFLNLRKDCEWLNSSKADWYHLDIMDGLFVPNISYGMPVIQSIQSIARKPLDVHLMIEKPERYVQTFADLGAEILTVHWEASVHLHRTLHAIKQAGMKAGVALNPHTPVEFLSDIISDIDLLLVMSVNPGFGGQTFIENTYHKVEKAKNLIQQKASQTLIEVDGGVNIYNAKKLIDAGADVLVAGSAIFGSKDRDGVVEQLKNAK